MRKPREIDFSRVPPHPGQLKVIEAMDKYRVVVHSPGRRWGKSSTRPYLIISLNSKRAGWVEGVCGAQSHAEAKNIWEKDLLAFEPLGIVRGKANEDQRRFIDFGPINLILPDGTVEKRNTGSRIWYPSLAVDSHKTFQGHGLSWAIMDEASHLAPTAWDETIRPMLADTGGPCLMQGSPIPDGVNFAGFAECAEMGTPGSSKYIPGWVYITGPSVENPHIDHEEVARQKAEMVARGRTALAECLYEGRFVTDIGAVFQNLDTAFVLKAKMTEPDTWFYRDPMEGEPVVIGLDFGRHDDATVVTVISRLTLEQLALMRIQRTEYPVQLPMIDRFVRRYPLRQLWAEGREEAAADILRRMYGDTVALVKWASGGKFDKATSVGRGMDYFDRRAVRMIDVEWQREEFRKYARSKTPSGRWEYNAPDGHHDDSVAAFLYATYGLPLLPEVIAPKQRTLAAPRFDVFSPKREADLDRELPFVIRRDW